MNLDINREWDLKVFLETPKCKGSWRSSDGGKCLLTAFWTAWGYDCSDFPLDTESINDSALGLSLISFTNWIARKLKVYVPRFYRDITSYSEEGKRENVGFTLAVAEMYDSGEEEKAINLLWKLIERLPNKKNWVSDLQVTPEVCGVK